MAFGCISITEVHLSAHDIAKKLGGVRVLGRDVQTEGQLIAVVREGLPSQSLEQVFDDLADLSMSQAELYSAVGSPRTLLRKRASGTRLSSSESDRLARVAQIVVRAEEAFGERDSAHRWLGVASRALSGQRPFDLLDSDAGMMSVERELGRIEHGVFG